MYQDIFQPILGIMAACGMVKGFNALFIALGLYSDTSGGALIINAIGDGLFTFLPLFLGYTSAKKVWIKTDDRISCWCALCVILRIQSGAISSMGDAMYTMFAGTIFAVSSYILEFFGIPVISMDYTGTVIPSNFISLFCFKM